MKTFIKKNKKGLIWTGIGLGLTAIGIVWFRYDKKLRVAKADTQAEVEKKVSILAEIKAVVTSKGYAIEDAETLMTIKKGSVVKLIVNKSDNSEQLSVSLTKAKALPINAQAAPGTGGATGWGNVKPAEIKAGSDR